MNKEIEEKLEENAIQLLDFVEKSSNFVVEQAPIYAQELIEFHFIDNAVSAVCKLLLILVLGILLFISIKWGDKIMEDLEFFGSLIFGCLFIFSLFICGDDAIYHTKECYKAKYAPRVLIIEKLRGDK